MKRDNGLNIEPGSFLHKYLNEGISNNEDNKPVLEYNTELLNYVGILKVDTEFMITSVIVVGTLIIVVMFVSSVMIYTAFKITYSERTREFGMLSSIGMNTKQRKSIIKLETKILGFIRYNYWYSISSYSF